MILNNYISVCRVLSCGFVCNLPDDMSSDEINGVIHTNSYDIHLQSNIDSQRLVYRHTVMAQLAQSLAPKKDQSTSRILTNDPFFNTTISKVSDHAIFFPAPKLYQIECSRDTNNGTCIFGKDDIFNETEDLLDESILRMRISHDVQTAPLDIRSYWIKAVSTKNTTKFDEDYDGVDSISCSDNFVSRNVINLMTHFIRYRVAYRVVFLPLIKPCFNSLKNWLLLCYYKHSIVYQGQDGGVRVQAGSRKLAGCAAACAASTPRKGLCDNTQQQIELDPAFTFWAYLAVSVSFKYHCDSIMYTA